MAPEQALGGRDEPGGRLVRVGVILFRALSARLPFGGRLGALMVKARLTPQPPSKLRPGSAGDLERPRKRLFASDPRSAVGPCDPRVLGVAAALRCVSPRSSARRSSGAIASSRARAGRCAAAEQSRRAGRRVLAR